MPADEPENFQITEREVQRGRVELTVTLRDSPRLLPAGTPKAVVYRSTHGTPLIRLHQPDPAPITEGQLGVFIELLRRAEEVCHELPPGPSEPPATPTEVTFAPKLIRPSGSGDQQG